MAFFDNIYNKAPPSPEMGSENFIIYTMDILNDPAYLLDADDVDYEDVDDTSVAVAFQGMSNFGVRYKSNVPFEPLENGEFSSDSIGGTPYEIAIVAEVSPVFRKTDDAEDNITNDEERRAYIGNVEDMLTSAINNDLQFVLLFKNPLFKNYTNIKLVEFAYDISVENKNMTAFLKFQEIRVTNPEYGYVPLDSVKQPSNSSQRVNGATSPQTPNDKVMKDLA